MTDDFDLSQKVNPIYIADDYMDSHPIWYDRAKIWWSWNKEKNNWEMKDDVDILNFIYRNLGEAGIVNNGMKSKYMNSFQMMAREREPEEMPKSWVQFKDSVFDIDRRKTCVAGPEFFFTNQIPWNFHTESEGCPTIDRLFEEWVGPEQKQMLYEICAYCLLSDYPIHRIFCLVGGGRNGKGTFMRLLEKLVGTHNVTSTSLERLAEGRFEITKLYRKLVAYISETNFAALNKTNIIKSAVGQDLMSAEYKNKPPFDFVNYAKVVIATNSLPATGDKTVGFYSRWVIIDFKNEFLKQEKDILKTVPDEEYEGLIKKCVAILPELIDRGSFTLEGTYQEKMMKYEEKSNPLMKFMETTLDKDTMSAKIPLSEFVDRLGKWLNDNRYRKMSKREVVKQLNDEGVEVSRSDYYDDEGRKQWMSVFGYKWKDNKKNGTQGSLGSHFVLGALSYESSENKLPLIPTIPTSTSGRCENCGEQAAELHQVDDKYDPRVKFSVCQSCKEQSQ